MDKDTVKEAQRVEAVKKKDNRQFEVEKSLPWLRMNPNRQESLEADVHVLDSQGA